MSEPTASTQSSAAGAHLTPAQLERIASGLEAALEASDDAPLIVHLDACDSCQQRLSETAAGELFWRQSGDLLRSAEDLAVDPGRDREISESPVAGVEAIQTVVGALLAPTERDDSLGRLGRFEVLGIVGSGGMGIVLKCRDVDIDRVVAIKIPAAHLWRSPEALAILEREARAAASVVHPHVIAIYQVDRWRGVPYLVMPYFPGPSLDRRIHLSGPLTTIEAVRITRQMAEALAAAHAQGMIHRDVKPGNILLGRGVERAVLSDFGLAKVQTEATLTASGMLAGTPSYLSPEQASGRRVGPSSDLFSLGSVLWTMLTGQVPWAGLHPHAIVGRIATGNLPAAEISELERPPWVWRLVDWMHQHAPDQRPTSADELASLLKGCEQHLSDPERHRLPERLRERHKPRWYRRALLATGSVLMAILILPVIWNDGSGEPEFEPRSPRISAQPPADGQAPVPTAPLSSRAPDSAETPKSLESTLDEIDASLQAIFSEIRTLQEADP